MAMSTDPTTRYLAAGPVTRRVMNPLVSWLVRRGVPLKGAHILHVRGRSSGRWQSVPVNPLTVGDERYLVAPRGQTQWVRNIRVSGGGRLQRGRRTEDIAVVEVADAGKTPILRAYLREWGSEVGRFFEGLTADSSDGELAAMAAGFPVFRVEQPEDQRGRRR